MKVEKPLSLYPPWRAGKLLHNQISRRRCARARGEAVVIIQRKREDERKRHLKKNLLTKPFSIFLYLSLSLRCLSPHLFHSLSLFLYISLSLCLYLSHTSPSLSLSFSSVQFSGAPDRVSDRHHYLPSVRVLPRPAAAGVHADMRSKLPQDRLRVETVRQHGVFAAGVR